MNVKTGDGVGWMFPRDADKKAKVCEVIGADDGLAM